MVLLSAIAEVERIVASVRGVEVSSAQANLPVALEVLRQIETGLGVTIPAALRSVYVQEVRSLSFSWVASRDVFGENCSRCNVQLLSPEDAVGHFQDQMAQAEEAVKEGLAETDEGYQALAQDWPYWFPAFRFPLWRLFLSRSSA